MQIGKPDAKSLQSSGNRGLSPNMPMSKSGQELWGLLERNSDRVGLTKIDADPANQNDKELFT